MVGGDIAKLTVDSVIDHLTPYSDVDSVVDSVEGGIGELESDSTLSPPVYPVCRELSNLGVIRYREALKDGFRVIYELIETEDETVVQFPCF